MIKMRKLYRDTLKLLIAIQPASWKGVLQMASL